MRGEREQERAALAAAGEAFGTGEGLEPSVVPLALPPEASDPRAAGAGARDRRQLLVGGSPREVLARIVEGDPLGLRRHVAERLRARALLIDADRVHLRSLARCAHQAPLFRGRSELDTWLGEIVEDALIDLLREDAEAERAGQLIAEENLCAYAELARPLGLEPARMRAACVDFNQLPEADRRAFFGLVIDGASLDELAGETGDSATELARRARRALETVMARASSEGGDEEVSR